MKNFLLSLAFIYGIGMSAYGLWWYDKDMGQLEKAVANGNEHVEMRHRINTWGNVGTILLAQLIATTAIAGMSRSVPTQALRKDEG
jgi:hypothetical protein